MKKLIIAAFAILGFSMASMAQTTPVAKKTEATKTHVKKAAKSNAVTTTPAHEAKAKATEVKHQEKTASNAKLKADGTPDKRYKENKEHAKLKANGTPDMRYKANKEPAKSAVVKKEADKTTTKVKANKEASHPTKAKEIKKSGK